ncbi:hypothetical protein Tco_0277357 [Tanacetum coccineum]
MSGVHNGKWCIIVALPSTPLIPNSRKLLPLSHMPDKKEDPKPNPHQPSIPYPTQLQEENFQALEILRDSLSPLPIPYGDSDSLMEETDTLISHIDDSFPEYETFCFDMEEM